MTDKTIKIELIGEQSLIDGGIAAFCLQHGYQLTVENEEGQEVQNTQPFLDYARGVLSNFMRDSIKAYNIEQARLAAEQAALDAATQSLDAITISASEG